MTKLCLALAILVLLITPAPPLTAQWAPPAADANAQKRIEWWREARVGLFMHWGLYAIPGRGEWIQWEQQIPTSEYARLKSQKKRA
jgi:alpha-L-fucosidase